MREWMKKAREKLNLTMKEAAAKLDISESYYSMIENGHRQKELDIALASRMASVFGVSLDYIVQQENALKST